MVKIVDKKKHKSQCSQWRRSTPRAGGRLVRDPALKEGDDAATGDGDEDPPLVVSLKTEYLIGNKLLEALVDEDERRGFDGLTVQVGEEAGYCSVLLVLSVEAMSPRCVRSLTRGKMGVRTWYRRSWQSSEKSRCNIQW